MNTKPDDETLALWLEDELQGEAHEAVEAWVAGETEWQVRREEARSVRAILRAGLAAEEELPSAEFFNARILREIEGSRSPAPVRRRNRAIGWLPAAAAGMILGFWMGRGGIVPEEMPGPVAELAPVLYTPEKGVRAEYVPADDATVIVLAGVAAIPDDWELPETAAVEGEADHTASVPLQ